MEPVAMEKYGWGLGWLPLLSKMNTRRFLFVALCSCVCLLVLCSLLFVCSLNNPYEPLLKLTNNFSRSFFIGFFIFLISLSGCFISLTSFFVVWSLMLADLPRQLSDRLLLALLLVRVCCFLLLLLCASCVTTVGFEITDISYIQVCIFICLIHI